MNLETIFSPKAGQDGLYKATIELSRHRELFTNRLNQSCFELGIQCGLTETEGGFSLGFESREEYESALALTEQKLFADLDAQARSPQDLRIEAARQRYSEALAPAPCRGE